MSRDPKTLSLANGEWICVICVEHVTGEEKYKCETLNVFVRESRMLCGRVCCALLSGFFGCLYWYLW